MILVSVDGSWAPRRQHETLDAALIEADRLAKLPELKNRRFRIVQEVMIAINDKERLFDNIRWIDRNANLTVCVQTLLKL